MNKKNHFTPSNRELANNLLQKHDSIIQDLLKAMPNHFYNEAVDSYIWIGNKNSFSKNDPVDFTFSYCIHGSEIAGLPLAIRCLENLKKNTPSLSLRFLLGNRNAVIENKRFIEVDLNRCFLKTAHHLSEEKRAQDIENILTNSKIIFDLHQTTTKSISPFLLIKNISYNFQYLNHFKWTEIPVIVYKDGVKFSQDGDSLSSFAHEKRIPFMTLELSEQGIQDDLIDRAFESIEFFLKNALNLKSGEKVSKENIQNRIFYQENIIIQKLNPTHQLVPGISNMQLIEVNSPLHILNNQTELATVSGLALFPKYGKMQEHSSELIRLVTPLNFNQLQL